MLEDSSDRLLTHLVGREHLEVEKMMLKIETAAAIGYSSEIGFVIACRYIALMIKHVHDEEQLMKTFEYGELANHAVEHQRIIEFISKIFLVCRDYSDDDWIDLVLSLRTDYDNHRRNYDDPFFLWMDTHRVASSGVAA